MKKDVAQKELGSTVNIWDEIQNEIKNSMPQFKDLPFFTRMKIRFTERPSISVTIKDLPNGYISQTYLTYFHNEKEYFYKFGQNRYIQ